MASKSRAVPGGLPKKRVEQTTVLSVPVSSSSIYNRCSGVRSAFSLILQNILCLIMVCGTLVGFCFLMRTRGEGGEPD